MEAITRTPQSGETQALRRIWRSAFGSADESAFFDYYYTPEFCITAVCDGSPVAAGYLLPSGQLVCAGQSVPCAMAYGVAALPEYRGRGFGAAVTRELISLGHSAGFGAIALCPSSDGLFEYYSSRTTLRDWFYVRERRLAISPGLNPAKLVKISAREYAELREGFLSNIPHIKPDLRAVEYQNLLCREFGGGLFKVELPDGVSCAVVEATSNAQMCIKELLAPDGCQRRVLSAVAAAFPANEYFVRTPARRRSGHCRRFGMLAVSFALPDAFNRAIPWFGLAFD